MLGVVVHVGSIQDRDGAKLLLSDIQYLDDEYEGVRPLGRMTVSRRGWGHGTPRRTLATILACKSRPEMVRIVHHDPKRPDAALQNLYEQSVNLLEEWNSGTAFDYQLGRDGDSFWL